MEDTVYRMGCNVRTADRWTTNCVCPTFGKTISAVKQSMANGLPAYIDAPTHFTRDSYSSVRALPFKEVDVKDFGAIPEA